MADQDNVVEFGEPSQIKAVVEPPVDPLAQQIQIIQRWRRILSVRWLTFIALVGSLAIWGYATIEPTPWRFGVACAFSVLVVMPTFLLYYKRSE